MTRILVLAACALSACTPAESRPVPDAPSDGRPTIASFTATPGTLPPGGGTVSLSWQVGQADTITIDQGVGAVTGASKNVPVAATTVFTLTATNAKGTSTASTTVRVGSGGGGGTGRFAAMVVPVDGETFVGSNVDLRLIGVGYDPNNFAATGPGGGRHQSASLQFILDGNTASPILTVDVSAADYWVFKGFANGLALSPGTHTVAARAIYTTNPGPAQTVDSSPVTITVLADPAYAQVIDMTGDQTVAQLPSLVGTAGARIRVNGNGHRIFDAAATAVDWQYVDFHGMGDPAAPSAKGIDVTTTGTVTVQNCRFDWSNPSRFSIGGTATASITGNLWRSNMRQPLGQLPYGPDSFPAVQFAGASTGAKTFAGNNVGAGWVEFQAVNHWTIGGSTDADSNVLIGARVGVFFDWQSTQGASTNIAIRRNFSHHIYYGGWSQGSNFELSGSPSILTEHNVLASSSWTIRGTGGEFRYNLVLDGGEDWMWVNPNAFVHHNVFVGGDLNRSGVYNTYGYTGIRILNNTFDGMSSSVAWNAIGSTGSETVTSNIFMNVSTIGGHSPIDVVSGALAADYNLFWNSTAPFYSDGRAPAANEKNQDPMLASPATAKYEFDEAAVWNRTKTVTSVLQDYRAKYAPRPGSPVIDTGDAATFGIGNDIGAIGAGADNAADLFGK
ncbi:MAG TPA: hypothetical protein VIV57_24380 [Anaeromyxobacter sp.]